MHPLKPLPDESSHDGCAGGFTLRKIRKSGETNLLLRAEKLIAQFVEDGEEMLLSDLNDLIDSLHRTVLLARKTKQAVLLRKLHRLTKKKAND